MILFTLTQRLSEHLIGLLILGMWIEVKNFLIFTIFLLINFQTVGFAATETVPANGEYLMSNYDTPEIACEIALNFAKQNVTEKVGIYLESYSRSSNFKLEMDEIKAVASNKIQVNVIFKATEGF